MLWNDEVDILVPWDAIAAAAQEGARATASMQLGLHLFSMLGFSAAEANCKATITYPNHEAFQNDLSNL